MRLRVGSRASRLALVQSEGVAAALRALGAEVELIPITTSGDRLARVALADFGGKALFVKEIEEALLAGGVDVGVHSLKDLPAVLPAGLALGAFPPRADPSDVLVTRGGGTLADLPPGTVVGTSSLRRRVLLLARRPDLRVEAIRGNVETRLGKLGSGECGALVMARAGLLRLGIEPEHASALPLDEFPPAVGQGILAVEVRAADRDTLEFLKGVDHTETRIQAEAERSFLERLGAGCHAPVAGLARVEGDALSISGWVASVDGQRALSAAVSGPASSAERLGRKLADELLARGARAILDGRGGP